MRRGCPVARRWPQRETSRVAPLIARKPGDEAHADEPQPVLPGRCRRCAGSRPSVAHRSTPSPSGCRRSDPCPSSSSLIGGSAGTRAASSSIAHESGRAMMRLSSDAARQALQALGPRQVAPFGVEQLDRLALIGDLRLEPRDLRARCRGSNVRANRARRPRPSTREHQTGIEEL